MPDTRTNSERLYEEEYLAIGRLFQTAETDEEWSALRTRLDNALSNAFLPRMYRALYEATRACCSEHPEEHVQRAKDGLADMQRVMDAEGRDQQYQDERLEGLRNMIGQMEKWIERKQSESEETETAGQYEDEDVAEQHQRHQQQRASPPKRSPTHEHKRRRNTGKDSNVPKH
ncbi:hypothetical protein B0A50_00986 [Salinomyces thailandicus]|uniref:Uncharacterized protein n=1 Tax=Salinomyces thailandicus TaxID=706561 RepID=A0A4U0UBD8_9PEZI|nr:hypothetical protein B0A50_00986 [Salinomyces thailandica]